MKAKYIRVRNPKGRNNVIVEYTTEDTFSSGTYSDTTGTHLIPYMPKVGVGATILEYDGKLYIYGGASLYGSTKDIYEFNLITQTLSIVATLPESLRLTGNCAYDNKIWITGGKNSNGTSISSIYVFDAVTKSVTLSSISLHTTMYGHSADIISGYMYIIGGSYGNYNNIWTCNLSTGVWTSIGTIAYSTKDSSVGTIYHTTAVKDNVIYVFGGWYQFGYYIGKFTVSGTSVSKTVSAYVDGVFTGNGTPISCPKGTVYGDYIFAHDYYGKVICINTTTGLLNTTHAMRSIAHPQGDSLFGCGALFVSGTTMYAFGGNNTTAISTIDISNPVTWQGIGKINPSGLDCFDRTITVGTKIFAVGGSSSAQGNIEYYDTLTETWHTFPASLEIYRYKHSLGYINGKIYVFGGVGVDGNFADYIEIIDTVNKTVMTSSIVVQNTYMGICLHDSKFYLCYGSNAANLSSPIQVFDASTETISDIGATFTDTQKLNITRYYGTTSARPLACVFENKLIILSTFEYNYFKTVIDLSTNSILHNNNDHYYFTPYIKYGKFIPFGNTFLIFGGSDGDNYILLLDLCTYSIVDLYMRGTYSIESSDAHLIGDYLYFLKSGIFYKMSTDFIIDPPVFTHGQDLVKEYTRYVDCEVVVKKIEIAEDKAIIEAQKNIHFDWYVDPLLPSEIMNETTYNSEGADRGIFVLEDLDSTTIDQTNMPDDVKDIITKYSGTFKAINISICTSLISSIEEDTRELSHIVYSSKIYSGYTELQ